MFLPSAPHTCRFRDRVSEPAFLCPTSGGFRARSRPLSYLAQNAGSVGVVVSLIFVGVQVKQNTRALQRNEHNSTMEQWTVIRMAIARDAADPR